MSGSISFCIVFHLFCTNCKIIYIHRLTMGDMLCIFHSSQASSPPKRETKISIATKATPAQQAAQFASRCDSLGWKIEKITDSVITITKRFAAGDRNGLVECDMEYYDVLSLCPLKGGSVWGTDCGGLGAISALNSGMFRMNKSGNGGKRFMAELRKIACRQMNY